MDLHFFVSNTFTALPGHDPPQLHVSDAQGELLMTVTVLIHDKWAAVGSTGDLQVPVKSEDGGQWGN